MCKSTYKSLFNNVFCLRVDPLINLYFYTRVDPRINPFVTMFFFFYLRVDPRVNSYINSVFYLRVDPRVSHFPVELKLMTTASTNFNWVIAFEEVFFVCFQKSLKEQ